MKRALCGIRWGCWQPGRRKSFVVCSGVMGCGRGHVCRCWSPMFGLRVASMVGASCSEKVNEQREQPDTVHPCIRKSMYLYRRSEAGNEKNCYEFQARDGLRFIIRLQDSACIVPTKS
jgi:hypothetical protein